PVFSLPGRRHSAAAVGRLQPQRDDRDEPAGGLRRRGGEGSCVFVLRTGGGRRGDQSYYASTYGDAHRAWGVAVRQLRIPARPVQRRCHAAEEAWIFCRRLLRRTARWLDDVFRLRQERAQRPCRLLSCGKHKTYAGWG